jgi:uncharacterized protein YndB with AHSA1/START domain
MTAQQRDRIAVTTPSDREIRIERVLAAPRELIFDTYVDPELIPEWWGPHGTRAIVEAMDVRPGGAWRYVCESSDGSRTGFRGTYREIERPERIQQTFEWDGMPGYVSVDTVTFEDLGDGRTKVVSMSLFHTTEERDGMLASGMEGGANETYERLEELLERKLAA